MKIFTTIIIFFLVISAKSQIEEKTLAKAYTSNSSQSLKNFYNSWNMEIPSITANELSKMNDTLRETYYVFNAFYKPHRIDSLGGSEWGNDIYKNVDYLIVQNSIKIYIQKKVYYTDDEIDSLTVLNINQTVKNDSEKHIFLKRYNGHLNEYVREAYAPSILDDQKKIGTDSIMDFRPQINCNGKLPLYLTPKYDSIINKFLKNNYTPLGTNGIMNPAHASGESDKRKKFLEKYIKIWYGHWGGYWQLISYPRAYSITFDKRLEYAKVDFRMVYEGGEAILKKENGRWRIIFAKRTWIE